MRFKKLASISGLTAIALGFSMLGAGTAYSAPTTPAAPDNGWNINIRWKYSDSNPYWGFAESRLGQKTKILMYCPMYGKAAPGAAEEQLPKYKWATLEVTYGQKSSHKIPTESTETINGKKYVDVRLEQCSHYMYDKEGYARDIALGYSRTQGTNIDDILITQQANTDFKFALTEGKIHPEDQKADGKTTIPITIGMNRTYNGKTAALEGNNGKIIENHYTFADKAEHHPNAEYNEDHSETLFTYAANGSQMDLYNNHSKDYKVYKMTAKFGDTGNAKNANGRYEIQSIEGNDNDGWTVKIRSNVKEVAPQAPTVEDSQTPGKLGKVVVPAEADPANPVWNYEQEKVNKAGKPDANGTYVKVTAKLRNPVLNYITPKATTEWVLNVSPKVTPLIPADKVDASQWTDSKEANAKNCATHKVTQTRTVTTTPYKWDKATNKWILDTAKAKQKTETQTREMTAAEKQVCAGNQPNNPGAQPGGDSGNGAGNGAGAGNPDQSGAQPNTPRLSGDQANQSGNQSSNNSGKKTGSEGKGLPKTGATVSQTAWLACLFTLGGVAFISRKRITK